MLLVLANTFIFSQAFTDSREAVIILNVLDGDTVKLEDGRSIRMLNINAAEKGRAHADEATTYLKQYENTTVLLDAAGTGQYGRTLGRLYTQDNIYINLELVAQGLVHAYLVDDSETRDFSEVEQIAIAQGKGLWQHSPHYECLDVMLNYVEEFVTLTNYCQTNMTDWTLKDLSTRNYKFKKNTPASFTLYSGNGIDTKTEYYWGRGSAWNDDGDAIFIRDADGLLVYYEQY